jgi:hypothetical protein
MLLLNLLLLCVPLGGRCLLVLPHFSNRILKASTIGIVLSLLLGQLFGEGLDADVLI